ncbi:MAG: acetylornithine/succinylornithine family transaminase [Verrucomicrobiota bacterium]
MNEMKTAKTVSDTKPRSSITSLYDSYVVPTYKRSLTLVKGQGSYVWDDDGKQYLDFGGGIACNCLGHSHPAIKRALQKQSSELIHTSNLYYTELQAQLAQSIVKLTGPGKVFFCNSGAESNEALYKLSRKFGAKEGRYEIITATGSFHGRTLGGISATGQEKVKKDFGPLVPGFVHAPFNNLSAFEKAMTDKTAAVLVEGIQGEGGINLATPEFILGLRKITKERNILFLWDGVQCGHFRTGFWQSYEALLNETAEAEDFLPDGVAMAKSLGGGFPMGATWIAQPHADLLQPGTHGTTFGGTPLACAVALAVLDEIFKNDLPNNIHQRGQQTRDLLSTLIEGGKIKAVRGLGGIIGFQPVETNLDVVARLSAKGLLTVPAGENIIRLLPPLNVTEQEVNQALTIIKETL